MIYDVIENISLYKGLDPHLDIAIDSIVRKDYEKQELGRHDVSGDAVFYFLQDNQLADPGTRFEYHRRYADLHFLQDGQEIISYGYDSLDDCEGFQEQSDIGFVTATKQLDLPINNRYFVFFLPGEAHLPNQKAGIGEQVRKCVYKILIDDKE